MDRGRYAVRPSAPWRRRRRIRNRGRRRRRGRGTSARVGVDGIAGASRRDRREEVVSEVRPENGVQRGDVRRPEDLLLLGIFVVSRRCPSPKRPRKDQSDGKNSSDSRRMMEGGGLILSATQIRRGLAPCRVHFHGQNISTRTDRYRNTVVAA